METIRGAAPRAPTHAAPGAGVPVAHRRERAALIDRTDGRRDCHSRRPRGAEARLGPEADRLHHLKGGFPLAAVEVVWPTKVRLGAFMRMPWTANTGVKRVCAGPATDFGSPTPGLTHQTRLSLKQACSLR